MPALSPRLALLVLLLLSGCVGAATETAEQRDAAASSKLPERVWEPPSRPHAVIVGVHGMNDHKGAFEEFGRFATEHGIRLLAYDQRGFGENPDRGLWPGIPVLMDDLRRIVARERKAFPELPLFVLGESMGGAVAAVAFAGRTTSPPDGLILAAPAVWGGRQLNPFYRLILWVAARVAPDLKLTGRGLKRRASDNLEMLRALARDPLFIKATRIRVIEGVVHLMDRAAASAERLRLPTLVLVGRHDEIIPPAAQIAFAARIGAGSCTRIVYPEGWHMLLRDLQRRRVWEDILAWIEGREPPSGLAGGCRDGVTVLAARSRPARAP